MVPGSEELLVRVQADVGKTQEENRSVQKSGCVKHRGGIVKITLVRTSAI